MSALSEVHATYCDGGALKKNPSPLGGTWCYCHVDAAGNQLGAASGVVTPADVGLPAVTNNFTELLAAVLALESLPEGWAGTLYTDSNVTRCRLTGAKPRFNGIPLNLANRTLAVRRRLGDFRVVLLGGHPTKADLAAGRRKDGLPVSAWNVFCDERCGREARDFLLAQKAG
jgi:ribonuclease HI